MTLTQPLHLVFLDISNFKILPPFDLVHFGAKGLLEEVYAYERVAKKAESLLKYSTLVFYRFFYSA